MSNRPWLVSLAMLFGVGFGATASAADHVYSEGPVMTVVLVRTLDGKFDEYMKWVDTIYKQEEELEKKAGYIVDYQVLRLQPRWADDPDVLLTVTFKNSAAMDGFRAKDEAIDAQVEGSLDVANQAMAERSKIRRVLGNLTLSVLQLK